MLNTSDSLKPKLAVVHNKSIIENKQRSLEKHDNTTAIQERAVLLS